MDPGRYPRQVSGKIDDCEEKIGEKLEEVDRINERKAAVLAQFNDLVPEKHEFHDKLLKIFQRKIKRAKKTAEGDDDEDDEEEEEDELDDDEDLDDEENSDTCPPGCDQLLYEKASGAFHPVSRHCLSFFSLPFPPRPPGRLHPGERALRLLTAPSLHQVCELRERRLNEDDALAEANKFLDQSKKERESQSKKIKVIETGLRAVERDIVEFQRDKQAELNKITLRASARLGVPT